MKTSKFDVFGVLYFHKIELRSFYEWNNFFVIEIHQLLSLYVKTMLDADADVDDILDVYTQMCNNTAN